MRPNCKNIFPKRLRIPKIVVFCAQKGYFRKDSYALRDVDGALLDVHLSLIDAGGAERSPWCTMRCFLCAMRCGWGAERYW